MESWTRANYEVRISVSQQLVTILSYDLIVQLARLSCRPAIRSLDQPCQNCYPASWDEPPSDTKWHVLDSQVPQLLYAKNAQCNKEHDDQTVDLAVPVCHVLDKVNG